MNENDKQQQDGIFCEYANAVYFDATAWDLSMTFGRTVLRTPQQERQEMEWTTAITIPWSQAKLMAYYLLINLARPGNLWVTGGLRAWSE